MQAGALASPAFQPVEGAPHSSVGGLTGATPQAQAVHEHLSRTPEQGKTRQHGQRVP